MKKLSLIITLLLFSFNAFSQENNKLSFQMNEVYNKTLNGNLYIIERNDVYYTLDLSQHTFTTEIKGQGYLTSGKVQSITIDKKSKLETTIYKFKWVTKLGVSNVTVTVKHKLSKVIVNINSISGEQYALVAGGNL